MTRDLLLTLGPMVRVTEMTATLAFLEAVGGCQIHSRRDGDGSTIGPRAGGGPGKDES